MHINVAGTSFSLIPTSSTVLNVMAVQIYSTRKSAPLDTSGVPGLRTAEITKHLDLVREATQKKINVTTESNSSYIGCRRSISVPIRDVTIHMDFLYIRTPLKVSSSVPLR